MPLVTSKGYDLVGGSPITQGLSQYEKFGQAKRVRETQAREDQLRQLAGQDLPEAQKMEQMTKVDPVAAEAVFKKTGMDTESKRAEASRFAAQLQSTPFNQRGGMIEARAKSLESQGRPAEDTRQLIGMNEAQQNQVSQGIQMMDLSTRDRLMLAQKQKTAQAGKGIEVKSSKILDDGTTIQVMKDGKTRVTSPSGENLTGDARANAIRESGEYGVDVQQRRSKGRTTGAGTGKIALGAFERVGKIRENISDLQEGINLIKKEGATTGFIQDFLPNMKASTRKLANLRRKLGLNVVGAVTFGALSKGELDLAMDVALPKGISEEETVEWIENRIKAQEKLSVNLEDAALFLADNTVADLIKRNRGMAKAAKKKQKALSTKPAANMTDEELQQELNRLEGK